MFTYVSLRYHCIFSPVRQGRICHLCFLSFLLPYARVQCVTENANYWFSVIFVQSSFARLRGRRGQRCKFSSADIQTFGVVLLRWNNKQCTDSAAVKLGQLTTSQGGYIVDNNIHWVFHFLCLCVSMLDPVTVWQKRLRYLLLPSPLQSGLKLLACPLALITLKLCLSAGRGSHGWLYLSCQEAAKNRTALFYIFFRRHFTRQNLVKDRNHKKKREKQLESRTGRVLKGEQGRTVGGNRAISH